MGSGRFRPLARPLAAVFLGVTVTACVSQTEPSEPSVSSQPAPAVATATVIPPSESAAPATPSAQAAEPALDLPPEASLAVEGGDPVVGDLGSFTWHNSGSDSPWLPGEPMRIGVGEVLTMHLAAGVGIERWTAQMQAFPLSPTQSPIRGFGQGQGTAVSFPAPPRGAWSVHVSINFAGNQGSAEYYWQITVE